MNMSYCRFHNTVTDMKDCIDYVWDMDLSEDENKKRIKFIELCREVAEQFEDYDNLKEYFSDNNPDD